jgi:hypothetical protein
MLMPMRSLTLQNTLTMPVLSSDGYVRLTIDHLTNIQLVHFFSAVDEEFPPQLSPHLLPTHATGYSEWISNSKPALSIGFDWHMNTHDRQMQCELVDTPRTNIMLVDDQDRDLGDATTRQWLVQHIATLHWQNDALNAILQFYVTSSCQN